MSVLDEILAGVREDLEERRTQVSLDDLKRQAQRMPNAKDPMPAFRGDGISIIAEVKRSSPSKGALAEITDPAALAGALASLAASLADKGIASNVNGAGTELGPMSQDEAADLLGEVVGAGVRVVAFEPIGSNLESAYLAMTEERR